MCTKVEGPVTSIIVNSTADEDVIRSGFYVQAPKSKPFLRMQINPKLSMEDFSSDWAPAVVLDAILSSWAKDVPTPKNTLVGLEMSSLPSPVCVPTIEEGAKNTGTHPRRYQFSEPFQIPKDPSGSSLRIIWEKPAAGEIFLCDFHPPVQFVSESFHRV